VWALSVPGQSAVVTPTCAALSDALAKCDFTAAFRTASGGIEIDRSGKSTVTFYPYGIDAVLSDEVCIDRVSQRVGIRSLCGTF
jgi:hypothetical protein